MEWSTEHDGITGEEYIAVMIPSRPNGVLNHGRPAYGYGPKSVFVVSICRSAIARPIHDVICGFDVSTRHWSARHGHIESFAPLRCEAQVMSGRR
jgi:hypothetical protein